MRDLGEQLAEVLTGRVCLLGLGNSGLGDDGAGVRLGELIAAGLMAPREVGSTGVMARANLPGSEGLKSLVVLDAGLVPERLLGHLYQAGYDRVLYLDAVKMGRTPGSVALMPTDEIVAHLPQVSTHRMAVGTMARYLEANGKTKVWLLGVQPETLRVGESLSPVVRSSVEALAEIFLEAVTRAQSVRSAPDQTC